MSNEVEFNSLTKDDVKITFEDSSHTSKPSEDEIAQHRKTRLALVVVFAVIVIVMVVVAVIIIIVAPKCEKKEEVPEEKNRSGDEWLKHGIIYQVYPRSFKDSGEDGNGDLKGILEKMDYFTELGVQAVWLSPIYDMKNFTTIDPMFGTIEDFEKFIKEAHDKGIKVVMGFVPNHSSNKHPWFVESQKDDINAYRDYYIWQGGPAKNQTPNNWMSVFGGSAWTYHNTTKQFYFHQFSREKPDLNLRNEKVKKELQDVLKFWLAKGVDGFNFDAVQFLIENDNYADETEKSNYNASNPEYDMLNHTLTYDLDESRTLVKEFQDFLNKQSGSHPILFTEVNGPYDKTSKYYEVSDIPFNFGLITKLNEQGMTLAQSINKTVIEYLASVPKSKTPNWVTGDDDHERIDSRVGEDNRHAMNVLALTLPGLVSTYYGVEIGMLNGKIADQTDPMDIARTPMQWNADKNAGFTKGKPWLEVGSNHNTINVANEKEDKDSIYSKFKELVELRKKAATLSDGELKEVHTDLQVFSFIRSHDSEHLLVIINFSDKVWNGDLDKISGRGTVVFDTESKMVGQEVDVNKIKLNVGQAVILENGKNEWHLQ